ncbi:hypothetical protein [Cellulomonas sp. SG140]|uniref:hypothetical protein n=1 Tax=Cellulomonas sp. SG140 TaxID=2976536 RepID=UPI0021E6F96A|nr:hypothetical protein [Cellulomonas sp. SG140]
MDDERGIPVVPQAKPVEGRAYPSAPARSWFWRDVVVMLVACVIAWAAASALSLRPWPWMVIGAVVLGLVLDRLLPRRRP